MSTKTILAVLVCLTATVSLDAQAGLFDKEHCNLANEVKSDIEMIYDQAGLALENSGNGIMACQEMTARADRVNYHYYLPILSKVKEKNMDGLNGKNKFRIAVRNLLAEVSKYCTALSTGGDGKEHLKGIRWIVDFGIKGHGKFQRDETCARVEAQAQAQKPVNDGDKGKAKDVDVSEDAPTGAINTVQSITPVR